MKKVYSVEFMKYTNYNKTSVASNTKALDYLDTHDGEPFLIFEDEIEKYQEYGGGIKSLNFVGYLHISCIEDSIRGNDE